MPGLTRLKKHKTIPFLDTSSGDIPEWARIGKSTVFDLVLNAQTEENDFIQDEMKTTEIMSYSPSLAQELQCNKGDPAFDYLYEMFFNLPTGEDVKKNLLIVFDGNQGTEEEPVFRAWNAGATLTLDHFDSVTEKIYFSFAINSIERGTATVENEKPVFTKTAA